MGRLRRKLGMVAVVLIMTVAALAGVSAQEGSGRVRVVHAVPGGPQVDIYVDGAEVLADVAFFTASDYQTLPAGAHRVQVTAAGGPVSEAMISQNVSVAPGQPYTVLVAGMPDSMQATVLEDSRAVPTAGDTKIRFIHAVPGAPAVDIQRVGADIPLVNDLGFGRASDYLPLLPGSYAFNVVAAGQTAVPLEFDASLLADEPIYDFFLVGMLPDIRAEVVAVDPAATIDQPTTDQSATQPAEAAQPTAQPTASTEPTAQPAEATQTTAQPTTEPAATAQPAEAAQQTAGQTPAQLPNTGGYTSAPLGLVLAALLLGGGAFLRRRGRGD